MSKFLSVLVLFIVIVIAISGWWYLEKRDDKKLPTNESTTAVLSSLSLNEIDREFVVSGKELSSVKIWSRDVVGAEPELVGEMSLRLEDKTGQTWVLSVPKYPIDTVEIFAVGYNNDGQEVGQKPLPFSGAEELYNALWLQVPFEEAELSLGEVYETGNLSLKLVDIAEDSRCPDGVECIQAGRVTVDLEVILNNKTELVSLKSDEGERQFGEYYINLIKVNPVAKEGVTLSAADYTITFYITKELSKL